MCLRHWWGVKNNNFIMLGQKAQKSGGGTIYKRRIMYIMYSLGLRRARKDVFLYKCTNIKVISNCYQIFYCGFGFGNIFSDVFSENFSDLFPFAIICFHCSYGSIVLLIHSVLVAPLVFDVDFFVFAPCPVGSVF